jgi:cytochrome d ubiquinol oxidase subunit II
MVIASGLAGVVTFGLVWQSRFEIARYTAAVAVGTILVGWAVAQRPDFLPGQLTFEDAAAGNATMIATLVAIGLALAVIIPSLAWLYRLKLEGRLEQRFHPIGTSEGDGQ